MKNNILGLVLFLVSPFSYSAYQCEGLVESLNQNRNGEISLVSSEIYGDSDGRRICSLTETFDGVTAEVCRGWLPKLLAAKVSKTRITVQYNDSNTCATQPTWSGASAPYAFWEWF